MYTVSSENVKKIYEASHKSSIKLLNRKFNICSSYFASLLKSADKPWLLAAVILMLMCMCLSVMLMHALFVKINSLNALGHVDIGNFIGMDPKSVLEGSNKRQNLEIILFRSINKSSEYSYFSSAFGGENSYIFNIIRSSAGAVNMYYFALIISAIALPIKFLLYLPAFMLSIVF